MGKFPEFTFSPNYIPIFPLLIFFPRVAIFFHRLFKVFLLMKAFLNQLIERQRVRALTTGSLHKHPAREVLEARSQSLCLCSHLQGARGLYPDPAIKPRQSSVGHRNMKQQLNR